MFYSYTVYETLYKASYALFILSTYHTFFNTEAFSFKMLLLTLIALIVSVVFEKHYKKAFEVFLKESKEDKHVDNTIAFSMTIEK